MRPADRALAGPLARKLVAALVLTAGASAPAPAADWRVVPSIDIGATRDDNIRLDTGPHETTSGYVAAAGVDVERSSPTSSADLRGAVVHSNYTSGEAEDRTDHRALLQVEQRTSERGTLGLRGEYRRDTLFETIVLEEGTGDIRDVDVGLSNETEVRRHFRVLQPTWTWLLTELSSVQVLYRFGDVNFGDAAGTGLVDYDTDLLSVTYNRQLTPQDRWFVSTAGSRYRPDDGADESDTLQLSVGMGRDFSETLEGSIAVGVNRTTVEGATQDERSSGLVLNASLRQTGEVSSLEGVVSIDVTPSGIGRVLQTDQLRLYWTRRLSPTLEFVFDVLWLQTDVVEGSDPLAERRYYDVSPRLRWQWLPNVSVVGSYRQRYQKYEQTAESADSSAVFLGLSYAL